MIPLLLFVLMGITILILFEWRARKQNREEQVQEALAHAERKRQNQEGECCGQHLVCERETLLQTNAEIVYYDDEELDAMAGIKAEDLSSSQADEIRSVFRTLKENDVPGWCRSMQLRNIQLPEDVREEALLIVQERRKK